MRRRDSKQHKADTEEVPLLLEDPNLLST